MVSMPVKVSCGSDPQGPGSPTLLKSKSACSEMLCRAKRRKVGFVMQPEIAEIISFAADGVDAREGILRIRPPRSRLSDVVEIEIGVQRNALPRKAPRHVQQRILVVVVAVLDWAVRVDPRNRCRNPESRDADRARNPEAVLAKRSALRQHIQFRGGSRLPRDEIV